MLEKKKKVLWRSKQPTNCLYSSWLKWQDPYFLKMDSKRVPLRVDVWQHDKAEQRNSTKFMETPNLTEQGFTEQPLDLHCIEPSLCFMVWDVHEKPMSSAHNQITGTAVWTFVDFTMIFVKWFMVDTGSLAWTGVIHVVKPAFPHGAPNPAPSVVHRGQKAQGRLQRVRQITGNGSCKALRWI